MYIRDSGNFVISVVLDFKKAFDTVDNKLLLSILDFYVLEEFHMNGSNHILVKKIK